MKYLKIALLAVLLFAGVATPVQAYGAPSLSVTSVGRDEFRITVNSDESYAPVDLYYRQENSSLWNAILDIGDTDRNGSFSTTREINSYNSSQSWYFYVEVDGYSSRIVNVESDDDDDDCRRYNDCDDDCDSYNNYCDCNYYRNCDDCDYYGCDDDCRYYNYDDCDDDDDRDFRFTTTSLPRASTHDYYDERISVTGGRSPYEFDIISGELPDGLSLRDNGRIQGTPRRSGTETFTVEVEDDRGRTITRRFTVTVGGSVRGNSDFANGALVLDRDTVYIIYRDQKIGFSNAQAFTGLGYQWTSLYGGDTSDLDYLSNVSSSNRAHPWGSWLRSGNTIYFMHEDGLIPVPSYDIFRDNGGQDHLVVPMNSYDWDRRTLPSMRRDDSRLE